MPRPPRAGATAPTGAGAYDDPTATIVRRGRLPPREGDGDAAGVFARPVEPIPEAGPAAESAAASAARPRIRTAKGVPDMPGSGAGGLGAADSGGGGLGDSDAAGEPVRVAVRTALHRPGRSDRSICVIGRRVLIKDAL